MQPPPRRCRRTCSTPARSGRWWHRAGALGARAVLSSPRRGIPLIAGKANPCRWRSRPKPLAQGLEARARGKPPACLLGPCAEGIAVEALERPLPPMRPLLEFSAGRPMGGGVGHPQGLATPGWQDAPSTVLAALRAVQGRSVTAFKAGRGRNADDVGERVDTHQGFRWEGERDKPRGMLPTA